MGWLLDFLPHLRHGEFISCLHEGTPRVHKIQMWIQIPNVASMTDMFPVIAVVLSAMNSSNIFTNVILSKLIARRNNLAQLSVLENSALMRSRHKTFKNRPWKKKRFWIKTGRTNLWWCNMIEGRCLEEDWKKNLRMRKADFMKLFDKIRPNISPNPRSPRPGLSAKKKVSPKWKQFYYSFNYVKWTSLLQLCPLNSKQYEALRAY